MKQFRSLRTMRKFAINHAHGIFQAICNGLLYEVTEGGDYKFLKVVQSVKG